MNITLYDLSVWVLPLVIAITFHEAAHGFVAHHFGDNTAWERGRVTFNPLRHIDPFGTLIMPAILLLSHSPFLFGYAKPVRDKAMGGLMEGDGDDERQYPDRHVVKGDVH